ncbi:hypothetical protein KBY80_08450 [Synechococcus sp. JJ3a-Johnson]|uniref:hypothetical protein n=1 Tax=unclassified Synechococcus TaxID=2626047 RepID=UPI0020CC3CE8|nr:MULTISPECIES: hypothetical protein [unclassified Synechococcus]MCP9831411.1 hypothetical protein [Synechococcus sp. JJ3a-Johnson]
MLTGLAGSGRQGSVEARDGGFHLQSLQPSVHHLVALRGDVVFSYAKGRISQIGLVEPEAGTEREPACRVTGLQRQECLVASHSKPWRHGHNRERLEGANGLQVLRR